jgi:hypothetical protein
MRPRWPRIFGLVFVIAASVLLTRFRRQIVAFTAAIGDIGPGHAPDDKFLGILAVGLICVTIVAVVKLLTHNQGGRP